MSVTICLTSCNRYDLLVKTVDSLLSNNSYPIDKFIITEDSTVQEMKNKIESKYKNIELIFNEVNKGPFRSIDHMYSLVNTKYIFHCEDDWYFGNNNPNFIKESVDILEENANIHQVWVRADCPKDWIEDTESKTSTGVSFNFLKVPHCGDWCGFSLNPGLRRKEDYLKMFPKGYSEFINPNKSGVHTEFACNKHAMSQGYRGAIIKNRVCKHIGYGRTTL